jgi:autotransporter strand-loop-strand O-heptosyltransferase
MFKSLSFFASFGDRTGYQVHASGLVNELEKLIPVYRNQPGGDVSISLLDVVTASQATNFPPHPSILMTVWESTEYPLPFIERLQNYDQLWLVSEWERSCAIAQGLPEEFIRVVPEGIDPNIYKPITGTPSQTFDFLVCGQWQPRKSTLEMVQAFLKAFPENPDVRLYLSTDTLFPSDPYKSTEERLEKNGIFDSRIIPVHFEEREAYVRRLQSAHVFLSCSRAEGFGLPMCEAMACGTPTIIANYSGSTEYSMGAILINVPKLEKPEGIYGNWQVPGLWGSPDYDHLIEQMRDVYNNYPSHKEKALRTSETIRTKFSWEAAAKKAYEHLAIMSKITPVISASSPKDDVIDYARRKGFEIKHMVQRRTIVTIDCHPSSQDRIDSLVETITQVKSLGYPILVVTHLPLPANVIEMVDYHIYDKRDILSGEDRPIYTRTNNGVVETTKASIPCHALAAIHNIQNAASFAYGKFDWMYHMSSDVEVDMNEWMEKVNKSEKDFICAQWEKQPETLSGQLMFGKVELFEELFPSMETWDDYVKEYGANKFCCEKHSFIRARDYIGLDRIDFVDISLGNRFDQLDREAWKDETFDYHFVDGPYLMINGMSNREYDIDFTTPDQTAKYHVKQKAGMWSKPAVKYFRDWTITARLNGEVKFQHHIDLKGKRVLVSMGSKALGDTIAWMPYIEEFRKKHECTVLCSGWWQEIFDYPEIQFVKPGEMVPNCYASYQVGCFDDQLNLNVQNWRLTPLQKVAADILGLEYEPIRAKLKFKKHEDMRAKKYICFSEYSTMRNKLWNHEGGWQGLINKLNKKGYQCVSVSNEPTQLSNVVKHNSQSIQNTMADIEDCEFYIGLNHGPAWVAYALGKKVLMITGVSQPWNDFPNPYRLAINEEVCGIGCFNDPNLEINRGWEWCGRGKDYVCTKNITVDMAMDVVNRIIGE